MFSLFLILSFYESLLFSTGYATTFLLIPYNVEDILGYEVLIAVDKKGFIFWDITLCSQFKVKRRFRGKCHFHLQG
jgi:hypothetical protein